MPVGASKKKASSSTSSTKKEDEEGTGAVGAGAGGASSASSSASSGSSSSSSSSSGSSSSSSDSSSSGSEDNSDDSNSSAPHTTGVSNSNPKVPKTETSSKRRSSRSCSSSRASSVASSASSSTSKNATATSNISNKTKPKPETTAATTTTTKKVTSTTTTKKIPTIASKPSTIAALAKNKSAHAKSKASSSSGAGANANAKKTASGKAAGSGSTSTSIHTQSASGSQQDAKKSKLIKSGSVTNTRTIKPLVPSSSSSGLPADKKKPLAPPSGKVLPGTSPKLTANEGRKVPTAAEKKKTAAAKKQIVPPDSSTKSKNSPSPVVKRKPGKTGSASAVVSTTTGPSTPTMASRTRSRSSCSSASASSASSSAASSTSEPEDSSMTESPQKQKVKAKKLAPRARADLTKNKSSLSLSLSESPEKTPQKPPRVQKTLKKKPQAVRNLKAELLSSADEEEPNENSVTNKKKPLNQRRPVTRRQKSSAKKTIPTTTAFNQSLLMAAANSTASPTSTPKKSSNAAGKSTPPSNALLPSSSSIVNRRSTTNSSATSEDSEAGTSRGRQKKGGFPLTTLTTLGQKNKYLSTWDSDFSDDNFNQHLNHSAANFIRVPAKTSNRPRAYDFAQGLMDADAYEPPRCPFPSCNSSGHLSGKYPNHNFLSCCPSYHGFETHECTENEEERSRRELERSRYRTVLSTPGKKPPKQTSETKNWLGEMKVLKEAQTHDGLTSQYDSLLWKDALAIAADRIEREQNEGITNQGLYYRLSMAVAMGRFEMKCWCESPYPEPLSQNRRLFVCEFCLKPVGSGTVLRRHCAKCVWRHPPGDEIYRKDRLSVWEVDGKKQKTYCQNLCLLAKCFLDHKTLYLDVDPFLFYVMTLADSQGCHIVGYFSKEKNSFLNYNVSCILTLPPYQRQGFGRLLIDFSYLLTRVEGKVGSPEKPLSDLGLISYRSYWKDACLRRLCACASREINIKDLSIELGVSTADLISTLQYLGMLKYWKGKHLVLKKQDVLEEYLERVRRRGNESRQIDSSCLRWRPFQPTAEEHSSSEKS